MTFLGSIDPDAAIPLAVSRRDVPSEVLTVPSASRSATSLLAVETCIARHEAWFGQDRLLRLIQSVPTDHVRGHVDHYRNVIRSRDWPNEARPTSLAIFLEEYERAALAYVAAAFQLFACLERPTPVGLAAALRLAEASEALRGQFGKRSPTGLDARLEAYDAELMDLLTQTHLGEPEELCNLLVTPGEPHLTAESRLTEDLAKVREAFTEPPTHDQLLRAEHWRAERAWLFLRRHAKWSLDRLADWHRQYDDASLREARSIAATRRAAMARNRHEVWSAIQGVTTPSATARIHELSAAMTLLNHLNLSLEPSFSFKSGVGLAHDLVFRLKQEIGMGWHRSEAALSAEKWLLFDTANQSQAMENYA